MLHAYDKRYRPELYQVERALILEILDTAWKDHLYYMDHLRSGIGLVGYAQLDPKVEYKREGRKTFLSMWDRVAQQVTSAIFRIEKESPGFVGSLWQITAVSHAEAAPMTRRRPRSEGQVGRDWPDRCRGRADPQSRPEGRTQRSVSVRQRQEI